MHLLHAPLATTIIWSVLTALWALDVLRLRNRVGRLHVLEPTEDAASPEHKIITAPGIVVDELTRRAASAWAREENLDVVDLVPADLPVSRALLFAGGVDPFMFRNDRFTRGRSAGYAMLVNADVLARASHGAPPRDLFEQAMRLKRYATKSMDFAIAPALSARFGPDDLRTRRALFADLFGDILGAVIVLQTLLLVAGLAGPFVGGVMGIVALAVYQLQPALIFASSALHPRGLLPMLLLRAPHDLIESMRIALLRREDDPVAVRRARYEQAIAGGLEPFFEPRREDCPLCASRRLEVKLETDDLLQMKEGAFRLERCQSCGHIFQNPRLSIAGLDYYYGDFYDGLGEEGLEAIFGWSSESYLARAKIVGEVRPPKRWLDVGAGHGHFCLVAREVWPDATFDGLDLSESIDEAARRKWIDRGYRGLFPDMAPKLRADGVKYDAVSMSHYLEHTRDPRAEIVAAREVLDLGGALMIEVPDPDSRLQWLLGRFWIPWFQPQHQHFVSVANLERILREEGFEPVRWHRAEAHQPVDFLAGATLLLHTIQPKPDRPWRAAKPDTMRALGAFTFWAGLPVLGVAWAIDQLAAPLFRRTGWSNTYRVVAKKVRD
jgi:SAM-dependent methyltransferase